MQQTIRRRKKTKKEEKGVLHPLCVSSDVPLIFSVLLQALIIFYANCLAVRSLQVILLFLKEPSCRVALILLLFQPSLFCRGEKKALRLERTLAISSHIIFKIANNFRRNNERIRSHIHRRFDIFHPSRGRSNRRGACSFSRWQR